jgi:hypothetical protein
MDAAMAVALGISTSSQARWSRLPRRSITLEGVKDGTLVIYRLQARLLMTVPLVLSGCFLTQRSGGSSLHDYLSVVEA